MNDLLTKDLIEEWNLGSLSTEKQMEIIDRIGRMVYQAILVRSLDILSEKEQLEFDNILDDNSSTPQDVLFFLSSKIPTFNQIVLEEKNNLKKDLLLSV